MPRRCPPCLPLILLLAAAGCGSAGPVRHEPPPATLADLPPGAAAALADDWAYRTLEGLCQGVGSRLAGSAQMADAAAWALAALADAGFDSAWVEPVTVPHWRRGREEARCTFPVAFELTLKGLGRSEGTGAQGIEAEILAVDDFEELELRAAEAEGRIVLFDPPWDGYGKTVRYRSGGASAAARHGAVACLIRSVTPRSLATPHTGVMSYQDSLPRIPAAAITLEDARRLHTLADQGLRPRVQLLMEAANLPDTLCRNVVGEIRGARWPDQIVLLGGHLDSWDVGTGAHDDGAGCVMTMAAARSLLHGGARPGRTVRVVFFTSEEFGGHGGRAYRDRHLQEIDRHVAALESDSGAFAPAGFSVQGDSLAVAMVRQYAAPLAALGADSVSSGGSGVDVAPLCRLGVPGIGHRVDGRTYFDYHHSPADTFDKVDPDLLARNVAALGALLRSLADDPATLPRSAPQDRAGGRP